MAYATFSDFEQFFEGFGTNYYGSFVQVAGTNAIDLTTWQNAIDSSYNRMNTLLDSIDRIPIVPIGTNPRTGSFHPSLIEWNCCDVIFTKMKARHSREFGNMLPEWMSNFGSRCISIYDSICEGRITLETDTTNSGIGFPVRVYGTTSQAKFFTNWDSGFYRGSDFPETYHVKVIGTTLGNEIGQAQYIISNDDGYTWQSGTYNSIGTIWQEFEDGIKVRWAPGTLTGTQKQLEIGDEWKFDVFPQNVRRKRGEVTYRRLPVG